jgi:nucleotide-binding universal stress UspA family protein
MIAHSNGNTLPKNLSERQSSSSNGTSGSILLALTDDELASSVSQLAAALAERLSASASLIHVIEADPVSVADGIDVTGLVLQELQDPGRRQEYETDLRARFRLNATPAASWPLTIDVGRPASRIATVARDTGAGMIVIGLHHHRALARAFGSNTAWEVMTHSHVPVLAATSSLRALPMRVVVPIDFSAASLRAALFARRLVYTGGTIHLLYVDSSSSDVRSEHEQGLRRLRDKGIHDLLAEVSSALHANRDVTVLTEIRFGNVEDEVQQYCDAVQPDLVALGRQNHDALERVIFGTVTRGVVDCAKWPVLVLPPSTANLERVA